MKKNSVVFDNNVCYTYDEIIEVFCLFSCNNKDIFLDFVFF